MTEHKHAAVLRAIAEGREVEYFSATNAWVSPQDEYDNPISHYAMEWRIKPEPRTPRRIWVNEYHNGLSSVWLNAPQSLRGPTSDGGLIGCIEFVEVLPDE